MKPLLWIRFDALFFSGEDGEDLIEEHGAIGVAVWLYAICRAKTASRGGLIPPKAWEPKRVATRIGEPTKARKVKAVIAWLEVKHVTRDGDKIQINNWADFQSDPAAARRAQDYRDRKKEGKSSRSSRDVTAVMGEKRREESRGEEKRSPHNEVEEDKGEERNEAQNQVELARGLFPDWPVEQIEQSIMKLRGAFPTVDLNLAITKAHTAFPPSEPLNRVHVWFVREAQWLQKNEPSAPRSRTPMEKLVTAIADNQPVDLAAVERLLDEQLAGGESPPSLVNDWIFRCRQAGTMSRAGYLFERSSVAAGLAVDGKFTPEDLALPVLARRPAETPEAVRAQLEADGYELEPADTDTDTG